MPILHLPSFPIFFMYNYLWEWNKGNYYLIVEAIVEKKNELKTFDNIFTCN